MRASSTGQLGLGAGMALALAGAMVVTPVALQTASAAWAVADTIPVGFNPFGTAVDEGTNTVYVAAGDNTVSVIDGGTATVTDTIAVGTAPYRVAVDPSNRTVVVTNISSNTVSIINGATDTVTATVPVPNVPYGVAVDPGTHGAYVGSTNGSTATVLADLPPITSGPPSSDVVGSAYRFTRRPPVSPIPSSGSSEALSLAA